jgi:hypothetical protein
MSKNTRRNKARHRRAAERNGDPSLVGQSASMSARDAIDTADAMDLPDGAYFAIIGDLMGGDYMTGIEACLGNG